MTRSSAEENADDVLPFAFRIRGHKNVFIAVSLECMYPFESQMTFLKMKGLNVKCQGLYLTQSRTFS